MSDVSPNSAPEPMPRAGYLRRIGERLAADGTFYGLAAVVLIHALMYLFLIFTRVKYPFAIDWLEDCGMYESREIALGRPLFPLDGGSFVPLAYPPVYYALVAFVGRLVGGVDFTVGRGVSNAAFIVSGVIAAVHVRRVLMTTLSFDRRHATALAASVLVLSGSAVAAARGAFDLARIDTLGGAFLICALVVGAQVVSDARYQRPLYPVAVAVLMTLAVYTKQLHLASAVAMALFLGRAHLRSGLIYAGAFSALCVGAFIALQSSSHGAFATYIFAQRHHVILPERAVVGASVLVIGSVQLPFTLLFGLFRLRRLSAGTRFWVLSTLATIPGALLAFAKIWGEANNFLPILMLTPIPMLLVMSETASTWLGTSKHAARIVAVAVAMFLLGKVTELDPFRLTPTAQQRATRFVDEIAKLDGDVVCPIYPFMPVLAGHTEPQTALLTLLDSEAAHIPNVTAAGYLAKLRDRKPRYFLMTGHVAERLLEPMLASDYHFVRKMESPDPGEVVQLYVVPNLLYERNPPKP